jgi:hypothetical protein
MNGSRNMLAWLLVALVAAAGAGGAVIGVVQSPTNAPLVTAVTNTLSARNYTQVLVENTSRGSQTDNLVFQSPDRLGGYIQSGNRRTYVYVIGSTQYQSVTVLAGTPLSRLVFVRQPSQGAVALDPAHGYLPYATQVKHPSLSGDTYSFSLTSQGQTGLFSYTVTGDFVSQFTLTVPSQHATVRLNISDVGTSPAVHLPARARVVTAPSGSGS